MSSAATIAFYDQNANDFFDQTINIDMLALQERFLAQISPGGHILDAGCGSGRDSKFFLSRGFRVTAIDASIEISKKASMLIEQEVRCCRFDEITERSAFDGVWANASLLHVEEGSLLSVVNNLVSSLRPRGIFFASFKRGRGARIDTRGRLFTDMTIESLDRLFEQISDLGMLDAWETEDRRAGHSGQKWCNLIGRKEVR